ncbi:MAG: hypothetical protein ABUK01_18170 [Leptospirales bacterium]
MIDGKSEDISLKFEKAKSSIAISFALIVIAIFMYFYPDVLGSPAITKIVSVFIAMIGIALLHGELLMLNHGVRSYKTENIGVGLLFVVVWALLYYFWPFWYVNIVSFLILAVGLFGIGRGVVDSIGLLFKPSSSNGLMVGKYISFVVLIAALGFTGWQLVEVATTKRIELGSSVNSEPYFPPPENNDSL